MLMGEVLKNKVSERGIPVAELARRAGGFNPDLLSKALRGEREPRAREFICVCRELGLSLDDFHGVSTDFILGREHHYPLSPSREQAVGRMSESLSAQAGSPEEESPTSTEGGLR